jgi:hypothetical protein
LLGIAQSVGLYVIYRFAVANGFVGMLRTTTIGAVAVMSITALVVPVLSMPDPYAYIGYGFAPTYPDSLVTQNSVVPQAYAVVSDIWGRPLVPNVYGPALYLLMSYVRVLHVPLIADLYVLRLLSFAAFAGIVALLARRLSHAALLTVALCPALYFDWVFDAHNDVFAVLFAVSALVLMRGRIALAVVCSVVAVLFKLSLLPVVVSLVAVRASLAVRIGAAFAIVVVTLLALAFFDGRTFVQTILPHAGLSQAAVPAQGGLAVADGANATPKKHSFVARGLLLAAIVLVVCCAVFMRRTNAGASFLFAAFAPAPFPWYLVWGIPYAALTSDTFPFLTIALCALTPFAHNISRVLPMQILLWGFALVAALVFTFARGRRPIVALLPYEPLPAASQGALPS